MKYLRANIAETQALKWAALIGRLPPILPSFDCEEKAKQYTTVRRVANKSISPLVFVLVAFPQNIELATLTVTTGGERIDMIGLDISFTVKGRAQNTNIVERLLGIILYQATR